MTAKVPEHLPEKLADQFNGCHPALETIKIDAPLRLKDAVKIAFPMGGMTVSGLRKEINRGRLEIEMIAGKQFTTLAAIERMRELCREQRRGQDFGCGKNDASMAKSSLRRSGSLRTTESISPRDALDARLTGSLRSKPKKP